MLKSRDMKKGTIVRIISPSTPPSSGSSLVGPPSAAMAMQLGGAGDFSYKGPSYTMVPGEEYELKEDVKKHAYQGMLISLKQVGGTKEGQAFWVWIAPYLEVVSKPTLEPKETVLDHEFSLNDDEEFVFVSKENPALVLRQFEEKNYQERKRKYGTIMSSDAKDVQKGPWIFNPKQGTRKRLKNKQVLHGYLHGFSGVLNYWSWHDKLKNQPNGAEQLFHLHGLRNMPDWVGGAGIADLRELKALELRKYNLTTRTMTSTSIDFDFEKYVRRFVQKVELTRLYGEAVSQVIGKLMDDDNLDEYPHLFTAKFDRSKFKQYQEAPPAEKDIQMDLALKNLKLKKKDIPHGNQNGFIALAFKTEAEVDAFAKAYQNNEKIIEKMNVPTILSNPELNLKDLFGEPSVSETPVPATSKKLEM